MVILTLRKSQELPVPGPVNEVGEDTPHFWSLPFCWVVLGNSIHCVFDHNESFPELLQKWQELRSVFEARESI